MLHLSNPTQSFSCNMHSGSKQTFQWTCNLKNLYPVTQQTFWFEVFPELSLIEFQFTFSNSVVFGYLILICVDFMISLLSVFSLLLVLIEKIFQSLKTMFDHICKVSQKYSVVLVIFLSSLLSVWNGSQTWYFVLDIVPPTFQKKNWLSCASVPGNFMG